MKHILVLGGGFAGVHAARTLVRAFGDGKNVQVTIVDAEGIHWFHADFYEIASSPQELTQIADLRTSIALPLKDIFASTAVHVIKDNVESIDLQKQTVQLAHKGLLFYDYIVYALGSKPCYYGIEGADKYTTPLKSFQDSLRVRNDVEFLIQRHRQDVTKRELKIVVIGGGFSGVELAAELVGFVRFAAWKYGYPEEKISVAIMEAATRVLGAMPEQASHDASQRLHELGVRLEFNSCIAKVDPDFIELKDGAKLPYDYAIWTAGIEAQTAPLPAALPKDRCGRIVVDETLRLGKYHNAFFVGDTAAIGKYPDPPTALYAIQQGTYVARAILALMRNAIPEKYQPKDISFIVPLGGTHALFAGRNFYTIGYIGYVLKIWRVFRYYVSLMGFMRACRIMLVRQRVFSRNDV